MGATKSSWMLQKLFCDCREVEIELVIYIGIYLLRVIEGSGSWGGVYSLDMLMEKKKRLDEGLINKAVFPYLVCSWFL